MRILRYWLAFKLLLVIAGIGWCVAVFRRWRDDVRTVRQPNEPIDRAIVIGFWIATVVVALLLCIYGISTIVEVIRTLTDW